MLKGKILNYIKQIGIKYNTKIYLVGGPLRDKLLGKETQDLDIVVEKNIKEIGTDLAKSLGGRFQYYSDFNTGTIHRLQGAKRPTLDTRHTKRVAYSVKHIDIAQTRQETYSKPAVLPKVFPSDLISDLFRRDFTINAIAQDLTNYELIDPYNGLSDLRRGVIRVLHPNSFIDDPTRIFRAIRFAERFNFKIEPKTLQWLRTAIKNKLPSLLSGERFLNELRLIMKETKSNAMISRLNKEEIFDSLFGRHLSGTFFTQFGKVAKPEEPNLMLIHLLAQFSLPEKFPLTKQEMSAIVNLKRFPEAGMALAKTNLPSDIYKVLRSFSDDALRIAEAIEDRKIARKIKKYRLNYQKVKIGLGGNDIKALGIPPGAAYSKMLDNLLFARLDGEVKNRTEEMKLLKVMVKRLRI